MIGVHALALAVLPGGYSPALWKAYSLFYVIGTLGAIRVPPVGMAPIKSLEQQIRDHSQQSAISDGRINVAYARKKKRLDEEYEVLLEAIDQKRRSVEDMDKKLEDCHDRERTKEDALKQLERQLVEVLVEQRARLGRRFRHGHRARCGAARCQQGAQIRAKRAWFFQGDLLSMVFIDRVFKSPW